VPEAGGGEIAVVHAHTSSVAETQALAAVVAGLIAPGDVVVLAGELGAGKTAFAQGFGAALGVTEPIVSPTFTIARQYAGRMPLHHLDVYRLEHLSEALDLAISEVLDEGAVAVIEWGDVIAPVLGADYLEVRIEYGTGDDDRRFALAPQGAGWAPRARVLEEALAAWAVDHPAAQPTDSTESGEPC
jgi:tRNA threonylcarbamoyladenosine biosynthesis protein TsaE